MKLLFVIPEYPPHSGGGIATFYRHFLPELAKQGHQVHAVVGSALSSAFPAYKETERLTIEALDLDAIARNLKRFDCYQALPELQRHLAAAWTAWEQTKGGQGYDLIETSDWGLLFVPWIVSSQGPPTVVQLSASIGQIDFYDPDSDRQLQGNLVRLIESNLLALADELQTYSQDNAAAWQTLIQRDVQYIAPALPSHEKTQPSDSSERGLVVGRIQYWKGPTVLCEAIAKLGDSAPIVDWIGRDTLYPKTQTSMSAYLEKTYPQSWPSNVRPLGTFSPSETQQHQSVAAFSVIPSLWDVFNFTCAEAMAQGQVVLCSHGAGAARLITNGVNGFTFPAGDSEALAQRLSRVTSLSTQEKERISLAARKTIQEQLSPQKTAMQRIEAYEKLLQKGRHPQRPSNWLLKAVSPDIPLARPLAFLDGLPLKALSQYVIKRSLKKTMGFVS
ncbi:MAG: hypothetical protein DCF25_08840 [Leptolyngbya foveolarum]|uniref:Glycosyltransferase subfamily 4-like N-terminal domain-containing protein n=1 Tax=Leptolyngbya foveolarum TaxID=47253 RepID=A0A2W4UQI5_9CYAN|nr:MAG: hypothetical protein DCF25_08840 [Leptolyngbya foveolarum]